MICIMHRLAGYHVRIQRRNKENRSASAAARAKSQFTEPTALASGLEKLSYMDKQRQINETRLGNKQSV